MNKEEIKKFAEDKEIPYLLHFTHISNLKGIMENGLISRDEVNRSDKDIKTNDAERFDGRTNTVSLSVAHPNDLMFYKYRDKDEDWCVLIIERKVLWEQDALFCKHNAADSTISSQSDTDLEHVDSFKEMYAEFPHLESRENQCLEKFDPTDKQAEILIKGGVPAENIKGVFFSNRQVKKDQKDVIGDRKAVINRPDKGVYASRIYRRKWQ